MKNFICILILLSICSFANGQQTNIKFFPSNPTEVDSIMVVMDFSFQFVNCDYGIVTNGYYFNENRIDFYPEFCPGGSQDSFYCITSDTLILPPIEDAAYDINVYVGMTGQCPVGNAYFPLDTISSTLQVAGSNSTIELLNEYFKVFPNPSYGDFTIEIENGQAYSLKVFNVLGQNIYNENLINKTNTISLSGYPNGVYFFEFEDLEHLIRFTKKIKLQ